MDSDERVPPVRRAHQRQTSSATAAAIRPRKRPPASGSAASARVGRASAAADDQNEATRGVRPRPRSLVCRVSRATSRPVPSEARPPPLASPYGPPPGDAAVPVSKVATEARRARRSPARVARWARNSTRRELLRRRSSHRARRDAVRERCLRSAPAPRRPRISRRPPRRIPTARRSSSSENYGASGAALRPRRGFAPACRAARRAAGYGAGVTRVRRLRMLRSRAPQQQQQGYGEPAPQGFRLRPARSAQPRLLAASVRAARGSVAAPAPARGPRSARAGEAAPQPAPGRLPESHSARLFASISGEHAGRLLAAPRRTRRVGRANAGETVDIQLADATISSRHAALLVDNVSGAISVEDTGSTNGTYVNDEHTRLQRPPRAPRRRPPAIFGGFTTIVKVIGRV